MNQRPDMQVTVLVVDDNPINLSLLFEYLSSDGYRVLVAEDGEGAIEQAHVASPDLILMDVLLPGMSGFDACRALQTDPETRDIPVIFLTALSRTSDKVEGFHAGGVDYLTKPLQFEEVSARIRTHVKIRDLQRELEQRNRLLEEANTRKTRAFSIIAHDLKSPISTFVSALRILSSVEAGSDDYAAVIESLEVRANRLDKFVDNLLEWAGLQLESGELQIDEFRVAPLVRQLVELSELDAEDKGISLAAEVPEELTVSQSIQAVRAALSNLISNAVKFTDSGGSVTIRVVAAQTGIRMEVTDTGTGMTPQEVEQLFDPQSRLHKPGTAGEKGSGLGLMLTHELVERMGGRMAATSEPGTGTIMMVELPGREKPDK